jgi:uncharacterized membrane protein YhaH (DUF805 family)
MDFQTAIKTCLQKYATFSGRAARSEYWWFMLFFFLVVAILTAINDKLGNVAVLAFLLPNLAVGARRLHDINKSGWFLLLGFIPIIGTIILIVWAVKKGDEGSNEYGEPPVTATADPALPPGAV